MKTNDANSFFDFGSDDAFKIITAALRAIVSKFVADAYYLANHAGATVSTDANGDPIFDPAGDAEYADDCTVIDGATAAAVARLMVLEEAAELGRVRNSHLNTEAGAAFNDLVSEIVTAIDQGRDLISIDADRAIDYAAAELAA